MQLSQSLLDQVLTLANEAGKHLARFYQQDVAIQTKSDNTPVTEADLFVSQFLIEKLTALSIQVRLPWGNEKEKARAERLATGLSHVVVLPKLSLNELADQIANAKAVVSVDTGLAHLTAALDKPNITLYGATDPTLIGCYGQNQHYLTANSMGNITSEQVLSSLSTLIK